MIGWVAFLMFVTGVPGNTKCDVDMESHNPFVIDMLMLFVALAVSIGWLFTIL